MFYHKTTTKPFEVQSIDKCLGLSGHFKRLGELAKSYIYKSVFFKNFSGGKSQELL